MKFKVVATLLGAASAVSVDRVTSETDIQVTEELLEESQKMQKLCEDINYDQIDQDFIIDLSLDEELNLDNTKYSRSNKNTYKKHYGKTKSQIDSENRHILTTQSKCLKFVKTHQGHQKVCSWCRKSKIPSIRWKWIETEKVWYRFYDGKWHYWGPSKSGFTAIGWTWYRGYWHHSGYVFKWVNGTWYRFQGQRWVKYGKRVPITPQIPRGPRICRPFYKLKKWGFPSSMGQKSLPRCKVGQGAIAKYYMWKDQGNCNFLGGKLIYMKHKTCKSGKPHQWVKVIRCVRGPVLTSKGFNYKLGKAKKIVKQTSIGGMMINQCYSFRSFNWNNKYLMNDQGQIFNAEKSEGNFVFKVVHGFSGLKNTVSLVQPELKGAVEAKKGIKPVFQKTKSKNDATFYVIKGLAGKGISLMGTGKRSAFFLVTDEFKLTSMLKRVDKVYFNYYQKSMKYKRAATYIPKKVEC